MKGNIEDIINGYKVVVDIDTYAEHQKMLCQKETAIKFLEQKQIKGGGDLEIIETLIDVLLILGIDIKSKIKKE